MEQQQTNSTLVQRLDLGSHHTIFRCRHDEGPLDFTAGQWTELGLPRVEPGEDGPQGDEYVKDGMVRRAYSICSAPGDPEVEVFFNKVDTGQLTRWLHRLNEGDRLYIDPECRGHFTLDSVPEDAELLFCATGSGIAPFVSLLRNFAGTRRWKRLALLYSGTTAPVLGYDSEFCDYALQDETFVYLPTVTREPETSGWQGRRGRLPELLVNPSAFSSMTGLTLDPGHTHVYLCGNSGMITDVENLLMPLGFTPRWMDPAGNIRTEIYY